MNRLEKALLVLLVIGLADAAYLSSVEFAGTPLYCSHGGIINCDAVIFSQYGYIFGVPLAYYAAGWFVVAIVLFFFVKEYRTYWFYTGLGGFIYSISAMVILGRICEYCTLLDVVLVLTAVVAFYSAR